MYTDMYEVQDDNGTIHSGTEEEMQEAFMTMSDNLPDEYSISKIRRLRHKWNYEWVGDLKLIQIQELFN